MFLMGALAGLFIGGVAGLLAGDFLAGELVSRDIVKD
jgi:gas vesicle protein